MASQYGYTIQEIFSLTLKQFQLLSSRANIREHNDFQLKIALAGGEPEFISADGELELDDSCNEDVRNKCDEIMAARLEKMKGKVDG